MHLVRYASFDSHEKLFNTLKIISITISNNIHY